METIKRVNGRASTSETEILARELLGRIADKWTLLVLDTLEEGGKLRFSRIRERVGGISQKVLTKTLRDLERDGLIVRTVHPVVPPHVDYELTTLGESLAESVCGVWLWVARNLRDVHRARHAYDRVAEKSRAAAMNAAAATAVRRRERAPSLASRSGS
jgi:DNA-binding HxlR family transcriptional regulator